MNLPSPATALINRTDLAVLSVLGRSSSGLTGRRTAALAGLPHSTVAKSLNRLADAGLVGNRQIGSALLHTVNRDHVVWPTVESALGSGQRLLDRYRDLLRHDSDVTLVLYGSVARGDANSDSDVDLLLVVPDGRSRESLIDQISARTQLWTGYPAQVYETTRAELAELARSGSALVNSWLDEGITLAGRPLDELIAEVVDDPAASVLDSPDDARRRARAVQDSTRLS